MKKAPQTRTPPQSDPSTRERDSRHAPSSPAQSTFRRLIPKGVEAPGSRETPRTKSRHKLGLYNGCFALAPSRPSYSRSNQSLNGCPAIFCLSGGVGSSRSKIAHKFLSRPEKLPETARILIPLRIKNPKTWHSETIRFGKIELESKKRAATRVCYETLQTGASK